MKIKESCWWCEKSVSMDGIAVHTHTCPAYKLNNDELELAPVLMGIEFCDHVCCGLPNHVCKAKRLLIEIKRLGYHK
jgi:hypothetical protein